MCLLDNFFLHLVKENWEASLHLNNDNVGMNRLWLKEERLNYKHCRLKRNIFKNIFTNIISAKEKVNVYELTYHDDPSGVNLGSLNEYKISLLKLQEQDKIY